MKNICTIMTAPDPKLHCYCLRGDFRLTKYFFKYLGWDSEYGVSSSLTCRDCGRRWLRYYYCDEAFSKSGRWFCGLLEYFLSERVSADNAKHILETMDWYYRGGSFYSGLVSKQSGKINLMP